MLKSFVILASLYSLLNIAMPMPYVSGQDGLLTSPEVCNNGLDDDLDGLTDAQDSDCVPPPEPEPAPEPVEECGDSVDNNGDGQIDEGCPAPEPPIEEPEVTPSPPAEEICGDGIDNNQNNQTDEGCEAPTFTPSQEPLGKEIAKPIAIIHFNSL